MNKKALKTLEFDKVLALLSERASCDMGKALCLALSPLSDLAEVRHLQHETADAVSMLLKKDAPGFGGVRDLRPSLKALAVGASISQRELLQLSALLHAVARVRAYGTADEQKQTSEPERKHTLRPLFLSLAPLSELATELDRCIASEELLHDDASPALKRIRREISVLSERVRSKINELASGQLRTYLQDAVVTMRDGRYCLPVKAEHRAQVPGMIHDQSATGATLFVEPMAIVKLNNDIRTLEKDELREIERILSELSAKASEHVEEIETDLSLMPKLDCIFARARLALEMEAVEPVFNTDGIIDLKKARHPLIPKDTVVPIDLRLGEDFDLLIVTGPNTGGKTISLKTLGLLCIMGSAGLHIPARSQSKLALFREIYADIGDEQSIEQSLSTFSSHMRNTVQFLEHADADSLVLFDELGAGTDPTEGAALAIAILSNLHARGVRTMATTHYSELKLYALQTPGVENASCEFDVESLKPTYRLLVGVPGKSKAFAISKRLGLSDAIIEDAKLRIDEQDASFEDLLSDLEQRRIRMESEQTALEGRQRELAQKDEDLKDQLAKLRSRRASMLAEAEEEAQRIIREAKQYADETIRDIRKLGKQAANTSELEKRRSALNAQLKQRSKSDHAALHTEKGNLTAGDVKPGDKVRVLSMKLDGIVSSAPDSKGYLFVRMGIMRSKVHISDLARIDEAEVLTEGKRPARRGGASSIRQDKSVNAGMEIKLIGKTVDEAISELDKFLDDAALAHIGSVRIIHGKGTGRLRDGIHAYLRSNRHVSSFRLAEYGEGDAGVTIAEL